MSPPQLWNLRKPSIEALAGTQRWRRNFWIITSWPPQQRQPGPGSQDLARGGKDAWHWPGWAGGWWWASALSRHWPNVRGKDHPSLFQNYNSLLQITMMDWRNVAGAAAWSAAHHIVDIGSRNSGEMLKCNNNRYLSRSHCFDQILSKIVSPVRVCMIEI